MLLTIMNPAVMEPSHAPRTSRTTNRPAKDVHAACIISATAHTKMLILYATRQRLGMARREKGGDGGVGRRLSEWRDKGTPHPFSNGKAL
jgi:hypothetical protein